MLLWRKIGIYLIILLISDPTGSMACSLNLTKHDMSKAIMNLKCNKTELECPEGCGRNASCYNRTTDYICVCPSGYHRGYKEYFCPNDSYNYCEDINECRNGTDNCGSYTSCNNTIGGYFCKCIRGYRRGNETFFCPTNNKTENYCTDIDECKENQTICGPNGHCTNTIGSYTCGCQIGFINLYNACEVRCRSDKNQIPCNVSQFSCMLNNFSNNFTPPCDSKSKWKTPSMEALLDDLDDLISRFNYTDDVDRLQKAGQLLQNVEDIARNLVVIIQTNITQFNKNKDININVLMNTSKSQVISLQNSNSTIELSYKTASRNSDFALVGCLEYSNISHILKGANVSGNDSMKFTLVSPVVTAFLGSNLTTKLDEPILLKLNFTKKVNSNRFHCAFWSAPESAWSTEGCTMVETLENGILCSCNHLTSFAILMALHDFETWELSLITKIGLSISIVCLILSIMTFCFCRFLHGTRNTIHTHLCVSLLLGNCIFLFGITPFFNTFKCPEPSMVSLERAVRSSLLKIKNIKWSTNELEDTVCGIVAGLLHALYLSTFCWMALEGLELYLMLVTVFNTHLKKRYLLAVGYGVPAVIVIISAAVYHKGYGTDKYCWLSRDKGFIWSFMGPVCVIILVNCFIFVLTVWKLAEKMTSINPEQGKLKRIRTLTMTSLAQICILGCSWAFGFLMFSSGTQFFAYTFTILNTLQGVQIFCLHCLMHKKVRADYSRWLCAIAHFKSPVYSEFSNTNTQTKVKTPAKESDL